MKYQIFLLLKVQLNNREQSYKNKSREYKNESQKQNNLNQIIKQS